MNSKDYKLRKSWSPEQITRAIKAVRGTLHLGQQEELHRLLTRARFRMYRAQKTHSLLRPEQSDMRAGCETFFPPHITYPYAVCPAAAAL